MGRADPDTPPPPKKHRRPVWRLSGDVYQTWKWVYALDDEGRAFLDGWLAQQKPHIRASPYLLVRPSHYWRRVVQLRALQYTDDEISAMANQGLVFAAMWYDPENSRCRFMTAAVKKIGDVLLAELLPKAESIPRGLVKSLDVAGYGRSTKYAVGIESADFDSLNEKLTQTDPEPDDGPTPAEQLDEFLSLLDRRERALIVANYGLRDGKPVGIKVLAKHYGISVTRVSQLIHRAEAKMAQAARPHLTTVRSWK